MQLQPVLQRINDQLGFLRNDLELSETGFTKSQAGVFAWAKSVGASESTIKEFAGTFDRFNKVMGEQSLDKSVNGFAMLNRQIREYEQSQNWLLNTLPLLQSSKDVSL